MKRTPLAKKSPSETALIKDEIQDWLREIVILRDGGCIARNEPWHTCSGYANDGHLIFQCDHLLPRSNSATYADPRLVVCICKGLHAWKSLGSNLRKEEYDRRIKELLPPDRVKLWEKCERARWKPTRTTLYDWKIALAALKQEHRDSKSYPHPKAC